jgi:hypothetical protein
MKRQHLVLLVLLAVVLPSLYACYVPVSTVTTKVVEVADLSSGSSGWSLPQQETAGANLRIAVFTYEDPDSTGLGEALATLMSHQILLKSRVPSIGMLHYIDGLSPTPSTSLSYFDKVEKITYDQRVTLAAWGVVRRSGERVVIDTYVQFPPWTVQKPFAWSVELPASMGGGALQMHLRPDRILVQRYEVSMQVSEAVHAMARGINESRGRPQDNAALEGARPQVRYWTYQLNELVPIGVRTRDSTGGGAVGHCPKACTPLLDAAGFIAGLLNFIESREIPTVTDSLGLDTWAVRDQLSAVKELDTNPAMVLQVVSGWLAGAQTDATAVLPGGAAFANLRALAKVTDALQAEAREPWRGGIAPTQVRDIAFELAQATLIDPRNLDVLHNLALLFQYAGEASRARLARELAAKVETEREVEPETAPR